jgi:hypothetical protein
MLKKLKSGPVGVVRPPPNLRLAKELPPLHFRAMSRAEIQSAIEQLSFEERAQLAA